MLRTVFVSLILATGALLAQAGDNEGLDVSSAIPYTFGQVVSDTMDASLRPRQVYRVTMARGQRFSVTLTVPNSRPVANLSVHLFASTVRTLANMRCGDPNGELIYSYRGGVRAVTFDYQVPAAGDYFMVACPYQSTGVQFQIEAKAEGTPLVTALPAQAGCLFGAVDFIEYSLRLVAVNLPDRLSIGGSEVCANCLVKPPIHDGIARKLEDAMRMAVNAEACYDDKGAIFKVKLQR